MDGRQFIKRKRLEKGLSLRRLALVAGVSHQFIKVHEDSNKSITFDYLIKILHALDISMFEYLAAIGYMKPVKNPADLLVGDAGLEPAPLFVAA
jgi:transcriptional regulator with XRE-family HTH domain